MQSAKRAESLDSDTDRDPIPPSLKAVMLSKRYLNITALWDGGTAPVSYAIFALYL